MKIETIDGVRGEWKTVTKASDIVVDQLVRYTDVSTGRTYGYDSPHSAVEYDIQDERAIALFRGYYKNIQAFFPIVSKEKKPIEKRKIAKITIGNNWDLYGKQIFHFIVSMKGRQFMVNCKFGGKGYSSRKTALRGAKRFCKDIGYEMELVSKGVAK